MPGDVASSGDVVDSSVHGPAGPAGQLAQPMAYVDAPSSLPE